MLNFREHLKLLRWKDWGKDKIPTFFMMAFYVLLADHLFSLEYIWDFFLFAFFIVSLFIYGYMINDLADLELDISHGKPNAFKKFTKFQGVILFTGIIATMVFSGYHFRGRAYFLPILIVWFFLATFYSVRPIRFKERGLIGLIVPFVCQFTIPTILLFSAFSHFGQIDMLFFIVYTTTKGASLDVGHQRYDYYRDLSTSTQTYGVRKGFEKISLIFRISLSVERIFLGLIIIILMTEIRTDILGNHWLPLAGFGFILLLYISLLISNHSKIFGKITDDFKSDPYYGDTKSTLNILHVILPGIVIPFYLLLLMSFKYHWNVLLILFFILWVQPSPKKLIWPLKAVIVK